MLVPFSYLILRSVEVDARIIADFIFRPHTLQLLKNTILLTLSVCLFSTLIAVPIAWLVVCSDLKYKKLVSFLSVMPLAIPGYVMAFALIAMGGYYGFLYQFFGLRFARPEGIQWNSLLTLSVNTSALAFFAAFAAILVALPPACLSVRYYSRSSLLLDRLVYFCYAVPSLPFALAMIFLTINVFPFIYQTFPMLVLAYALSYAALAMGPIKTTLLQRGTHLEETAQSFGYGGGAVFMKVTVPALYKSFISGGVLVFLVVVKDLPLAMLLSPTGFKTLSMEVFHRTEEAMLVDAAPYAGLLVLFSAIFVAIIVLFDQRGLGTK